MSPLQAAKAWLVDHVDLAKDALHIYVGLGAFLAAAALFGWRVTGWRPWTLVFAVAMAGEVWDVRDSLVYDTPLILSANLHDTWNTLFWPSLILVTARTTRFFPGEREQPSEQTSAVGAAVRSLDPAIGMRHHAKHVAGIVQDPGDAAR